MKLVGRANYLDSSLPLYERLDQQLHLPKPDLSSRYEDKASLREAESLFKSEIQTLGSSTSRTT